jgi:hypothetical protein
MLQDGQKSADKTRQTIEKFFLVESNLVRQLMVTPLWTGLALQGFCRFFKDLILTVLRYLRLSIFNKILSLGIVLRFLRIKLCFWQNTAHVLLFQRLGENFFVYFWWLTSRKIFKRGASIQWKNFDYVPRSRPKFFCPKIFCPMNKFTSCIPFRKMLTMHGHKCCRYHFLNWKKNSSCLVQSKTAKPKAQNYIP